MTEGACDERVLGWVQPRSRAGFSMMVSAILDLSVNPGDGVGLGPKLRVQS